MEVFFCLLIFFLLYVILQKLNKNRLLKKRIDNLAQSAIEYTPEDFLVNKKTNDDFTGVYIIYNINKNIYYVGQAKQIFQRVNSHFKGRGNGDVYFDYRCGNKFTVKLLKLENSGYSSLNKFEKDTIYTFNAFKNGYNKTKGNSDNFSFSNFIHPYTNGYTSKYSFSQINALLKKCAEGKLEASFEEYCEIRKGILRYNLEFPGIYIIHNKTKHLYFIGKTKNSVFDSINKHFTGNGNNNIYADYRQGDNITIKTIALKYDDYASAEKLIVNMKIEYNKIADNYSRINQK